MTSVVLSALITIVFSLSQVCGVHPNIFVPTSNATCQPDYGWMNSTEQRNPCLTVAYVIAACAGDTWTQPALPSGYSYNSPSGTTATPCYCSWSCYNLMMACTLCQNTAYTSYIVTWPSFSQNCSPNYKDQVFPQGYVLADNATIPYWATIDPTTWPSELFDVAQAETYYSQNQSYYSPSIASSSSPGSSTNLGAIIGGSVGGAVALLLILIGGYFLYKHRQHRRLHNANDTRLIPHMGTPMTSTHARWPSDPSTVFSSTQMGSPPTSYTSMQPHGVGMGMSVLSPTSYSSFQVASPPPTDTASFFTTGNPAVQRTHAIPII